MKFLIFTSLFDLKWAIFHFDLIYSLNSSVDTDLSLYYRCVLLHSLYMYDSLLPQRFVERVCFHEERPLVSVHARRLEKNIFLVGHGLVTLRYFFNKRVRKLIGQKLLYLLRKSGQHDLFHKLNSRRVHRAFPSIKHGLLILIRMWIQIILRICGNILVINHKRLKGGHRQDPSKSP